MAWPTFEEWLATLTSSDRQNALELLSKFKALGAKDPENWARSEISEDFAQLARHLVLRGIWPNHIDSWSRSPETWVGRAVEEANGQPDGHFADAGRAIGRALAAGVPAADLGAIARMVAYRTAFGILDHIDGGSDPAAGGAPGWVLMETSADGQPTGRPISALHEDILSMDPTGREGRPS